MMTPDEIIAQLTPHEPLHPALATRELYDAAIYYAGTLGWPIFPLKVGEKTPATRNGLHDATTDLEQIIAWWDANPWQNIGVATGHHFDVIDIDAPDGFTGFHELCQSTGERPRPFAAAHTGNGGRHLLVPPTGRGNFANLRPGVDYRGTGGYIVAPPSRLAPDGRPYTWVIAPDSRLACREVAA
jgi:hypothetical protein